MLRSSPVEGKSRLAKREELALISQLAVIKGRVAAATCDQIPIAGGKSQVDSTVMQQ